MGNSLLNTIMNSCLDKESTLRKRKITTPITSVIKGSLVMAILKEKTAAWKLNYLNGLGIMHS